MQITLKTSNLKSELEESLKEYDLKYADLVKLYREKMSEYINALDLEVAEIIVGRKLRISVAASYLQTNRREVIIKAIKAVSRHTLETLEMSDTEYHNIVSAIENEVNTLTSSYNTLGGTCYGGNIA